jgi:hypothetical protein
VEQSKTNGRNRLLLSLHVLRPILAAVALPILLHAYLHLMFCLQGTFDGIRLGTSRVEVYALLMNEQTKCARSTGDACVFRDPWREYSISFDKQSGLVVYKQVIDMRPRPLLLRIMRRLLGMH